MEELLEKNFGAGRAELVRHEHVVNRGLGLFGRLGDDHALAGGQSVRLHDDGKSVARERGLRLRGVRKHLGLAGRHARGVHDLLRETLRALHARTGGNRTERGDSEREKLIDEALHQRRLGTDHDEVGIVLARPLRDGLDVFRADGDIRRNRRRSRIAGRTEQLVLLGILRQTPGDRVFTSATANNQNLHFQISFLSSWARRASARCEANRS